MTAKDLIRRSLIKAEIIATGETPTNDELQDGLDSLNDLLAEWSSDGLGEYVNTEITKTLEADKGTYTVGPGGDIAVARPERLLYAFLRDGENDSKLNVITPERYDAIPSKETTGTPRAVSYRATMPTGTISFHPVPTSGEVAHLFVSTPITEIASINTDLSSILPRGYISALKWGLAVELCPEYGKQVNPVVMGKAASSKRKVEAIAFSRKITPVGVASMTGLGRRGGCCGSGGSDGSVFLGMEDGAYLVTGE